jgi:hypothetical protein
MKPQLSIVIPALNEVTRIQTPLWAPQAQRAHGVDILLAIGDSSYGTTDRAAPWVDGVVSGPVPGAAAAEDIERPRRLKRLGRPACWRSKVCTSGPRWGQPGVWRSILLIWQPRWRYWRGERAARPAAAYQ